MYDVGAGGRVYHATFFDSLAGNTSRESFLSPPFFTPLRLLFPFSRGLSTCPVCERRTAATSSGVPVATTRPPCAPPSGPRSIMKSALLITSRLCSITVTVWARLARRWSTAGHLSSVGKCSQRGG